ncbi:MAG: AraC family transcriptional regulator [Chitinophagaceae bacterium]
MDNFLVIPPAAPLKTFIRYYVVADVMLDSNIPVLHEFVPLTFTALTFLEFPGMINYQVAGWDKGKKSFESSFIGPMSKPSYSTFICSGKMVTIHFSGTGIFRLFNLPQSDFLDTGDDASSILNTQEIVHLRERIFTLSNPMDIAACLNHFFYGKLNTSKDWMNNIGAITSYINNKKGNINIDWLTTQANMSVKTLERHFNEKIGLSPKLYARIARFSHAMKMLRQNKGVFDIIEDCGYTDQSHFIKEMREFSGRTPKLYYKMDKEEEFGLRLLLDNMPEEEKLK